LALQEKTLISIPSLLLQCSSSFCAFSYSN
jgi:hypothetical protein